LEDYFFKNKKVFFLNMDNFSKDLANLGTDLRPEDGFEIFQYMDKNRYLFSFSSAFQLKIF